MSEETRTRREKLEDLRVRGLDPYPKNPERLTTIAEAQASFDVWAENGQECQFAGRLFTIRVHGGMMFADLKDESGKIQIAFKQDEIGEEVFALFRDTMDPGDFVEVRGVLFLTKRGERTLSVRTWRPLAKALQPLPEKWHGLQDVETRYRERELDLLSNPEVKERFLLRSRLVSGLRRFLDEAGFIEVETPMLHPIAGGANARPFITHHNALNADFFLRIAPELYLKRLLVGGFERVYEIGRCFRNEGIDHTHNPEFTMMELYWAFAGKERFIAFLEDMMRSVIRYAVGTDTFQIGETTVSFAEAFPRVTFRQAVLEATGIDINHCPTEAALKEAVMNAGLAIDFSKVQGLGECLDELYKQTARQKIVSPVWVLDYPAEMKPLCNVSDEDPTKASCAQLVMAGAEIVNAFYYELNDPLVQRERLEAQERLASAGSEEAQRLDESFLRALEHGMPPAGGMGMGIDRLVSLLTNAGSLKEVILFPTLRPKQEEAE